MISALQTIHTSDGYSLKIFKKCDKDKYGSYSTINDAKDACRSDENCQGIYNVNCRYSSFHLCPKGEAYEKSKDSCVYDKGKRVLLLSRVVLP